MNYLAPNTFQEAGANHRWRGPFRCRDPRRESAVALLSFFRRHLLHNTDADKSIKQTV